MNVSVSAQAAGLFLSLALGAAAGVLYDILRTARRRLHIPALLADIIFWLAAAFGVFTLGMSSLEGQTRLYMLIFTALGCALYFYSLSPLVLKVTDAGASLAALLLRLAAKPFLLLFKLLKKFQKNAKSIFQYLQKRYNISYRSNIALRKRYRREICVKEEAIHEDKAGRYNYEARYSHSDRIRGDNSHNSSRAHRRGKRAGKRA